MLFAFVPDYSTLQTVQPTWDETILLSQQGMFGADIGFAYSYAGPALKTILDAIPASYHASAEESGLELNIDVRVHQLEVGDFPASPGWHCDAPQRETAFSDSLDTVPVKDSLVANVSSHPEGVSNTVFATEPVELEIEAFNNEAWVKMSSHYGTDLTPHHVSSDGEMVMFSCYTPHCIQPAKNAGVRMFVRISQWQKPEGFTPGLTRSEQVYRLVPPYLQGLL